MNRTEACSYKKLYDTEFEVQRAVAIMERRVDESFVYYPCGKHWHIAHEDRELRNKHVSVRKDYCEVCQQAMRPGRYTRHITTNGHIRNARRQEDV